MISYFLLAALCLSKNVSLFSLSAAAKSLKGVLLSLGVSGILKSLRTFGIIKQAFCTRLNTLELTQYRDRADGSCDDNTPIATDTSLKQFVSSLRPTDSPFRLRLCI